MKFGLYYFDFFLLICLQTPKSMLNLGTSLKYCLYSSPHFSIFSFSHRYAAMYKDTIIQAMAKTVRIVKWMY